MGNTRYTERAVVLLGGGLESTACALWALEHFEEVTALHFLPSPKLQQRACRQICKELDIGLEFPTLPSLLSPELAQVNTFIPGRNVQYFVSSWQYMYEREIGNIVFGGLDRIFKSLPSFHDQRFCVMQNLTTALNLAFGYNAGNSVKLHMPFAHLNKDQILDHLPPLVGEMTVSCNEWEAESPCGECQSCRQRNEAIEKWLLAKCAAEEVTPSTEA